MVYKREITSRLIIKSKILLLLLLSLILFLPTIFQVQLTLIVIFKQASTNNYSMPLTFSPIRLKKPFFLTIFTKKIYLKKKNDNQCYALCLFFKNKKRRKFQNPYENDVA